MEIPKTLTHFKNHPIFILPKHLLKFEALHPENPPVLGYFKDMPVYSRSNVFTLQSRERWFIRRGRSIKEGEVSLRKVTRKTISQKEKTLELFGKWQTQRYIPVEVKDGKIIKNEFGNVEIYKPWMLPKNSVHITCNNFPLFLHSIKCC
uniref:DNA repair protein complementing XP-C cells homolog (Trinotate prediction) n=1 Tax=Henneguya salminicola TaxID=69463 RepID=A0A6G3MKQ0_HENSL